MRKWVKMHQNETFSPTLELSGGWGFRNTPPYRETCVAIPLSHCVSCHIADYAADATPPELLSMKVSLSDSAPELAQA